MNGVVKDPESAPGK